MTDPTRYDDDRIDSECLALSRAGTGWRDHLPDGAVVANDGDPVMRDQVVLPDGTRCYHAPEAWGDRQWYPIGWSNASKARAYRPVPHPLTATDEAITLGEDA